MTCCPCLIITVHLYSIKFYTAYFSDEVYCAELCDIPLLLRSRFWYDGPQNEYSNTFKFQVIRKTVQQLRNAYAAVHTGSALPNAPHLFPQFANLSPRPPPAFPLTLVDRVPATGTPSACAPLGRAPLLFTGFAQRDDGSLAPVHVKFTADRTYGGDAHLLLAKYGLKESDSASDSDANMGSGSDIDMGSGSEADAGAGSGGSTQTSWWPLAPAFLHCRLFPGADTRMVYMATLEGDTLEHLLASGAAVSEADLADVYAAVEVLHRYGFVHGDIRPSNVIVQLPDSGDDGGDGDRNGGRTARAYLLDFDLAGREGKARYPYSLSKHVRWPRPPRELRERLITKRHDLFMLKNLLRAPPQKREASPLGAEDSEIDDDWEYDDNEDEEEDSHQDDSGEDEDYNAPWRAILTREKVVDFFRAWNARGGTYAPNINPRIKWPRPAEELRFQPITKAHDQCMFEEMREEIRSTQGGLGA